MEKIAELLTDFNEQAEKDRQRHSEALLEEFQSRLSGVADLVLGNREAIEGNTRGTEGNRQAIERIERKLDSKLDKSEFDAFKIELERKL